MTFFQALLLLFVYDILCTLRPFKVIHATIKRWRVANKSVGLATVDRICTAVNYACAWYPKQALCLQRSFVTTYLLRKRGVPATMVLGAQNLPFKAHAWVEVSGQAVNERSDIHATYAVWDRC